MDDAARLQFLESQLAFSSAAREAVSDVLRIMASPDFDLNDVVATLLDHSARICNADRAAAYHLEDGEFVAVAVSGVSDEGAAILRSTRLPKDDPGSLAGRVYASAATVHIPDVLADATYSVGALQQAAQYRSLLGVPIKRDRDVYGLLSLGRRQPEPFSPMEIAMMEMFAEQALVAIESAALVKEVARQRQRADELLRVILPEEIVRELEANKGVKPRRQDDVAVLFCDIAGFTEYCDGREPQEIVAKLQELTEAYEDLAAEHGLQKIKTIGDCFMAVAGLLAPVENPVLSCLRCGLDMIDAVKEVHQPWNVRVGIHVGPVVAGVLGHRQYLFDLWGDTVNTASRIESNGVAGCVTMSPDAVHRVAEQCECQSLGMVPVKGKGELEIFRFSRWR